MFGPFTVIGRMACRISGNKFKKMPERMENTKKIKLGVKI
jgi:hypothetical protein